MCGQKVTKKPLKKRSFLRIFLYYGVFCLRYDLFVWFFSMSSLGRCRSNRWNHSLALWPSSLGSPPSGTVLFILPGHRHGAGGTALLVVDAWRTLCAVRQGVLHGGPAGRNITFCQSHQGSAQPFRSSVLQNEPPGTKGLAPGKPNIIEESTAQPPAEQHNK